MVAQVKPTSKNSPAVKVGKNRDNASAEVYAARGTKDNKVPEMSVETGAEYMNNVNIGAGTVTKGNYAKTKTDGVAQRGHGAATKGFTSRGPMA
jgi:hypothetical protein